MKHRRLHSFLTIALLGGLLAPGYAQEKTRPATAADFVGVFRLLDYPLQNQPKILKPPWPSPCQFFGHYPDGYWLHQESRGGHARIGSLPRSPRYRKPFNGSFLGTAPSS